MSPAIVSTHAYNELTFFVKIEYSAKIAKMAFVMESSSLGNILLVLLLAFIVYLLIDLYQFRSMPPGPRFTNLPLIGNLFSFNFDGEIFQDAVAR